MRRIAILMTVHNRKAKTLRCLASLKETSTPWRDAVFLKVFLTDDGSTDGTAEAIRAEDYPFDVRILPGDGNLFWNGGMIQSWKAALGEGGWDGYLWLNDDVTVLPAFWPDLLETDQYCQEYYRKRGIYVGSTQDAATGEFTYGGFIYTNKFTLKDKMLPPDETIQPCEAGHGNITYVAAEVVEKQGVFCDKYIHGGTDHDYTYLAHKAGFPVLVLPHYSAVCEKDHPKDGGRKKLFEMPLKERLKAMDDPRGLNLHNALLFSRRCFPLRYPLILATGYFKAIFPKTYYRLYLRFRGVKPPEWSK
ncbi:MAG: glycosyltransferase family 2 protein [Bacteroidales bacterium]|nr:glycosyltransferase family 2 protein [Bacteroidales bacterium]